MTCIMCNPWKMTFTLTPLAPLIMISPKGIVYIPPQIIKVYYRMGILHLTTSLKTMVCIKNEGTTPFTIIENYSL
jgi:hypothetical protein